jgi:hypothetical protein
MPHLYRPESDKQRSNALTEAKAKYEATAAPLRAFSTATYDRLVAFLPTYKQLLQQRGSGLSQQATATAAIKPHRRMLRLYIGHFIIGLDNAMLREEVPKSSDRAHFQLPLDARALPKLTTDEDLLQWAKNVVAGETARINAGGTALSNPSAAQVQNQLNSFEPLCKELTTTRTAYDDAQEAVAAVWQETDELLKDIWDEVLFHFRKDQPPSLRRKAREWGLVYRENQKKTEQEPETDQAEEPQDSSS